MQAFRSTSVLLKPSVSLKALRFRLKHSVLQKPSVSFKTSISLKTLRHHTRNQRGLPARDW